MRITLAGLVTMLVVSAVLGQTSKPAQQPEDVPEFDNNGSASLPPSDPGYEDPSAGPSLDRLNNFPEDYIGQTVTLGPLWLDGDMERVGGGNFEIAVRDRRTGKSVSTGERPLGITFVLSNGMARKLQDHIRADTEHGTRLTCFIRKVVSSDHVTYWKAEVQKVEFLTVGGRVAYSVESDDEVKYDSKATLVPGH